MTGLMVERSREELHWLENVEEILTS